MKHPANSNIYVCRGEFLAWILGDRQGIRQAALHALGVRTTHFHHDLHSRGHGQYLLRALEAQQPQLLWTRLAGPCVGSGNRHDNSRTDNLMHPVREQLGGQRFCVIESNARSQARNLRPVASALQHLNVTRRNFCNYQSLTEREAPPCKAVILSQRFRQSRFACRHCSNTGR